MAVGPGSGVKILNQPVPPAFRKSTKLDEQNLYSSAKVLVGDRDPRGHEFSVQLRAMDNTQGGTIVVGSLNLGGSVEMIPNAVSIAELAVEKQARVL